MFKILKVWPPVFAALVFSLFAVAAHAACCSVPTSHQVRIPSVVVGQQAAPQGCNTNCGNGCDTCKTPPTPCNCETPPSCQENCGSNRRRGQFNASVVVNVTAAATASATANAAAVGNVFANSAAFGFANSNSFGNGGSSFSVDYNNSYISNLSVEAAAATASVSVPYQATRQVVKIVAVQAVCLDDKLVPHPASQVSPDREIADGFEGELYRCIAGARMQFTLADFNGKVSFDHGQTITCDKHNALYHVAGGRVECRPERPARDCNERSLLRRFGAGIKILKIVWTETYTAYRTEVQQVQATAQASATGMAIDGGVGGIVH